MFVITRHIRRRSIGRLRSLLFCIVTIGVCQQTAYSKWDQTLFQLNSIADILQHLYGTRHAISVDYIDIQVPQIAENNAVVPVSINVKHNDVDAITILVDGNEYPLVAHQNLAAGGLHKLGYRIKMEKSSNVIVVIRSLGKLYTAKKPVKITIGSCGCGEVGSANDTYRITPSIGGEMVHAIRKPVYETESEKYQHFKNNSVVAAIEQRTSTFSVDVDSGSYSNIRRHVYSGQIPPKGVVRVEEMLNYFNYHYPAPETKTTPFNLITEISKSPWNTQNYLLHIGIKGYETDVAMLPALNLVFLLDVSGSMQAANKLGLLIASLKMMTPHFRKKDTIAIVVYAGAAGIVLPPTSGNEKDTILAALNRLSAGGSTNGEQGIQLAYQLAKLSFKKNKINRLILGTDGDFNVGTSNTIELIKLIEENRKSGISLSTLGFGTGNYNDELMEQLADHGNGNYAYIDNLHEAYKVLVHGFSSTLNTIAKDVKIQIEFNPATVAEYRLIGYENRVLDNHDFKNDKTDAGEIGSGHTVTAIYEMTLVDSPYRALEPQRYANPNVDFTNSEELATLRIRFKHPEASQSRLITTLIMKNQIKESLNNASIDFRFASAVAAFGQKMRQSAYVSMPIGAIIDLADTAVGKDEFGYRRDFLRMARLYKSLLGSEQ